MKPILLVLCLAAVQAYALPKHPGNRKNAIIRADGTAYSLNLSGKDGRDGRDGRDGSGGGMCENGDNGDSGASGEDGENGGNLIAYATDLSKLRNVQVEAIAGRGGRGGSGGNGGPGGPSGRYETCTGSGTERECSWHDCSAGYSGKSGSTGSSGKNGQLGNLYIIASQQEVPKEVVNAEASLKEILQRPVVLAEHTWQKQEGSARDLLSPGSDLADDFYLYTGTREHTFKVEWAADSAIEKFENETLSMNWVDGKAYIRMVNSSLGTVVETIATETQTTFVIKKVIAAEDMANIQFKGLENSTARGPELVFEDLSKVSDIVKTTVSLYIQKRGFWSWKDLYMKNAPPEAVSIEGHMIRVQLNKLGIEAKYLKGGEKLYYRMTLIRQLGDGYKYFNEEQELKIPKLPKK